MKEPRSAVAPATARRQHSLLVRGVYFVVGWWLSRLWTNVAAFLAVTIVGLPVAYWMFNRLPYVTSLYRFDGQTKPTSLFTTPRVARSEGT